MGAPRTSGGSSANATPPPPQPAKRAPAVCHRRKPVDPPPNLPPPSPQSGRKMRHCYTANMGHTFAALFTHFAFSTKDREPLITPDIRDRLYSYAGGVARSNKCTLLVAGGMPDHVHLLIQRHPEAAEADLMRLIKTNTSGWIHETFPDARDFAWQRGYGSFSVSKSALDSVRRYIEHQEEHHKTMNFQQEFIALLQKHGVEYDPQWVWT